MWPVASQREALQLVVKALAPKELDVPPSLWRMLAPPEGDRNDPERFTSSAGYLFSPEDGARAISEIVVGGLLDPQRMERVAVIAQQSNGALLPGDVVAALLGAAFPSGGNGSDVVQTQVARRLMILSADANATSEVQSAALAGVFNIQKIVRPRPDAAGRRLNREIELFLSNPQQNLPKVRPSGAPPGPPV